jgi:hypothetical protein
MHCLCVERRNKGIGHKTKLANPSSNPFQSCRIRQPLPTPLARGHLREAVVPAKWAQPPAEEPSRITEQLVSLKKKISSDVQCNATAYFKTFVFFPRALSTEKQKTVLLCF